MADALILGGVTFDGFSTPSELGAGGEQSMVVHKLPGGARVIDTLGPDEADITWQHYFFSNDALSKVLTLDGMRAAGSVIDLTFAGQFRSVIIKKFEWKIRRYPVWINYSITLMVYQNPSQGISGSISPSIDTLILSDLSAALLQ
jgi:hypothetical protein